MFEKNHLEFEKNQSVTRDYPSTQRLLILGCGDVGLRLIRWLRQRHRHDRLQIIATARRAEQATAIRRAGAMPMLIDLDDPISVKRLAAIASWVIVLAPPSERSAHQDLRSKLLIAQLRSKSSDAKLIYVSTTGVFGDSQGAWIDECFYPRPSQARSLRRLSAEQQWLAAFHAVRLRVPGIYAEDRLPLERIRQGKPCMRASEDSYSNHIHADDLAMILWLCLFRSPPARLYATVDNEPLQMGEWFDHLAKLYNLPAVPRVSAAAVKQAVSPMMWSFMQESRRIHNGRMHLELKPRLKAPSARRFLAQLVST